MDDQAAWPDPIPFRSAAQTLRRLDPDAAGRLLAAAADIALVIDDAGVIRDLAIGDPGLAREIEADWVGRRWDDTVTGESRNKIGEMLRDGNQGGARRWRQVNHPAGGGEIPIRYLAIDAADVGTIAIGRDLRATAALQQRLIQAQQAMERDHLRLRQAESRYRMLFDLSPEAVVVADAGSRKIIEANAAAGALSGVNKLVGQPFTALVDAADRDAATAMLGAAAAADQAAPNTLRLAGGARARVAATLFRQGRSAAFLIRLTPADAPTATRDDARLGEILERVPDAFALTDAGMSVVALNGAFLDLTEYARAEDVVGQPLGAFLGRPGIDASVMSATLRETGSLRNFATIARGRFGAQEEVEVSAVAALDNGAQTFGFAARLVGRRAAPPAETGTPRSVEQLTELVGRMSLKDIVRESTDLIERLCIEAALDHTANNRASAAEILGLSRQSLYSKLHRHGLAKPGDIVEDEVVKPR